MNCILHPLAASLLLDFLAFFVKSEHVPGVLNSKVVCSGHDSSQRLPSEFHSEAVHGNTCGSHDSSFQSHWLHLTVVELIVACVVLICTAFNEWRNHCRLQHVAVVLQDDILSLTEVCALYRKRMSDLRKRAKVTSRKRFSRKKAFLSDWRSSCRPEEEMATENHNAQSSNSAVAKKRRIASDHSPNMCCSPVHLELRWMQDDGMSILRSSESQVTVSSPAASQEVVQGGREAAEKPSGSTPTEASFQSVPSEFSGKSNLQRTKLPLGIPIRIQKGINRRERFLRSPASSRITKSMTREGQLPCSPRSIKQGGTSNQLISSGVRKKSPLDKRLFTLYTAGRSEVNSSSVSRKYIAENSKGTNVVETACPNSEGNCTRFRRNLKTRKQTAKVKSAIKKIITAIGEIPTIDLKLEDRGARSKATTKTNFNLTSGDEKHVTKKTEVTDLKRDMEPSSDSTDNKDFKETAPETRPDETDGPTGEHTSTESIQQPPTVATIVNIMCFINNLQILANFVSWLTKDKTLPGLNTCPIQICKEQDLQGKEFVEFCQTLDKQMSTTSTLINKLAEQIEMCKGVMLSMKQDIFEGSSKNSESRHSIFSSCSQNPGNVPEEPSLGERSNGNTDIYYSIVSSNQDTNPSCSNKFATFITECNEFATKSFSHMNKSSTKQVKHLEEKQKILHTNGKQSVDGTYLVIHKSGSKDTAVSTVSMPQSCICGDNKMTGKQVVRERFGRKEKLELQVVKSLLNIFRVTACSSLMPPEIRSAHSVLSFSPSIKILSQSSPNLYSIREENESHENKILQSSRNSPKVSTNDMNDSDDCLRQLNPNPMLPECGSVGHDKSDLLQRVSISSLANKPTQIHAITIEDLKHEEDTNKTCSASERTGTVSRDTGGECEFNFKDLKMDPVIPTKTETTEPDKAYKIAPKESNTDVKRKSLKRKKFMKRRELKVKRDRSSDSTDSNPRTSESKSDNKDSTILPEKSLQQPIVAHSPLTSAPELSNVNGNLEVIDCEDVINVKSINVQNEIGKMGSNYQLEKLQNKREDNIASTMDLNEDVLTSRRNEVIDFLYRQTERTTVLKMLQKELEKFENVLRTIPSYMELKQLSELAVYRVDELSGSLLRPALLLNQTSKKASIFQCANEKLSSVRIKEIRQCAEGSVSETNASVEGTDVADARKKMMEEINSLKETEGGQVPDVQEIVTVFKSDQIRREVDASLTKRKKSNISIAKVKSSSGQIKQGRKANSQKGRDRKSSKDEKVCTPSTTKQTSVKRKTGSSKKGHQENCDASRYHGEVTKKKQVGTKSASYHQTRMSYKGCEKQRPLTRNQSSTTVQQAGKVNSAPQQPKTPNSKVRSNARRVTGSSTKAKSAEKEGTPKVASRSGISSRRSEQSQSKP